MACGAITEAEALATGLTLEEIRSRSFLKILQDRRAIMSGAIEFRLNGKTVRIDRVSPNVTLLEWLRAERTDWLEGRMCRGRLRRLFGGHYRSRCAKQTLLSIDQQLSRPAPADGGTRHRHGRRRRMRQTASRAAGDGGKFRIAMRLLHARFHHVAFRRLLSQGSEDRRAARRTTLRQSLPLHWLPADSRRSRGRFRAAQWRRMRSTNS